MRRSTERRMFFCRFDLSLLFKRQTAIGPACISGGSYGQKVVFGKIKL